VTFRDDTEATVGAISVLSDDVRRRVYFHVRAAPNPISRDQAAELAGISRNLAAFHLEKLVAASLLKISQPRLPRLRRPGRSPKLYSPADTELEFSLPPRRYDAMAAMLVEAVHLGGEAVRDAALRAARSLGVSIGAATLGESRLGRLGTERAIGLVRPILEQRGYEPEVRRNDGMEMLLRNCPFHGLLSTDKALICALNCEYVGGILEGLRVQAVEAQLVPRPEHCCVTVASRGRATDED